MAAAQHLSVHDFVIHNVYARDYQQRAPCTTSMGAQCKSKRSTVQSPVFGNLHPQIEKIDFVVFHVLAPINSGCGFPVFLAGLVKALSGVAAERGNGAQAATAKLVGSQRTRAKRPYHWDCTHLSAHTHSRAERLIPEGAGGGKIAHGWSKCQIAFPTA